MSARRGAVAVALLALACSCRAGGCVANVLGDIIGETGDAYCDRRHVGEGKDPAPFCQEIIDTIALGRFQEDCRDKHLARTGEGTCPRERIIAGCKLQKENDDGSEVWDWYYDVSDLEAEAGADPAEPLFPEAARTKEDVRRLCEDPSRYEEGASYAEP